MTKEVEQNDMRVRNASSEDRSNRAMEDRAVTHNRELSDDERIEMFRSQYFQHVLPDVPKIPGYHTCWLSTTSQNDTIIRREMLGYEPIRKEDIPGWNFDAVSVKTGEHAGLIGINEMVAFKIRDSLYQAYMREAHFDAPNRQDEKLVNDIAALAEQAKANKTYIQSHDGHDEIESGLRRPSNPVFT